MFSRLFRSARSSDRRPQPLRPKRDSALAKAIAADAIGVQFQPQIDPRSGAVLGVEALARWDGCDGAELLFARAAAARLDERLSRSLQRKAIRAAAAWTGPLADLGLSLNALPADLARSTYVAWLLSELKQARLDPARLTIEIVESALLLDEAAIAERLTMLRAAGIRIAIDDFGTGYSNLSYLASLPLDALKIDRAMVADLVGGSRDRIVVKAMIGLARELGLDVIVEGVETSAQLALLADWGCDRYQGFLGAGSLDEPALARFVAAANARPLAA